jgi:S-DNA-T family DNA segregation ATPase FtsK/SpoIIIE
MEMDRRDLLEAGCRNLRVTSSSSSAASTQEGPPLSAVHRAGSDELADLMMTAGKEVETPLRLAQLAAPSAFTCQ